MALVPSLDGVGVFKVEMSLYESPKFEKLQTRRTFNSVDKTPFFYDRPTFIPPI